MNVLQYHHQQTFGLDEQTLQNLNDSNLWTLRLDFGGPQIRPMALNDKNTWENEIPSGKLT